MKLLIEKKISNILNFQNVLTKTRPLIFPFWDYYYEIDQKSNPVSIMVLFPSNLTFIISFQTFHSFITKIKRPKKFNKSDFVFRIEKKNKLSLFFGKSKDKAKGKVCKQVDILVIVFLEYVVLAARLKHRFFSPDEEVAAQTIDSGHRF